MTGRDERWSCALCGADLRPLRRGYCEACGWSREDDGSARICIYCFAPVSPEESTATDDTFVVDAHADCARRASRVRVLIVDDEPDMRLMLRMQLRYDPRFEVAGEAVDGQDALDACEALDPDLIVLDIRMPRLDGLKALPLLRERCPRSKVALYSAFGSRVDPDFVQSHGAVVFDKNVSTHGLADGLYEFFQRAG